MESRNKVLSFLIAAVFAFTAFFTQTAGATEVETSLSAKNAATLSAIDSMGVSLPDEVAKEMRGGGYLIDWRAYVVDTALLVGIPAAVGICSFLTGGACLYAAAAAGGYFIFTSNTVMDPLREAVYVQARFSPR